jgi:hypothetical protein
MHADKTRDKWDGPGLVDRQPVACKESKEVHSIIMTGNQHINYRGLLECLNLIPQRLQRRFHLTLFIVAQQRLQRPQDSTDGYKAHAQTNKQASTHTSL